MAPVNFTTWWWVQSKLKDGSWDPEPAPSYIHRDRSHAEMIARNMRSAHNGKRVARVRRVEVTVT